MLNIGNSQSGITGENMLTIGGRTINVLVLISGIASGDVIVNEDGSGDNILFENGDNWIVE